MHIINFLTSLHALASLNFAVLGTSPHPPIIIDVFMRVVKSIFGL